MFIRQGDIALIPSAGSVPFGACGAVVLARGIATGHAHTLSAATADRDPPTRVYVADGCTLTHPEHAHIAVPPGVYDVRRQTEGDNSLVQD